MNRRRIIMIIIIVLTGIDIGLLWDGGPNLSANTEWDQADLSNQATIGTSYKVEHISGDVGLVDGAVPIRAAEPLLGQLSAAGKVELISKREVVLSVAGTVSQVDVAVGDHVKAGALLLALENSELQRAVDKAQAELQSQQAELSKLYEGGSAVEITAANANLASAQQNLSNVQRGASPEEIAAAESKLSAANAKYAELQAGPNSAELDEALAELQKADIGRQEAQREYDKVAWRNDIGATPESALLQKATIDFEKAQAKVNRVSRAASQSDLQAALSEIQDAQHKLDSLRNRPNAAEIAEAQAKVAEAEKEVAKLHASPSEAGLLEIQSRIQKAQLELEEAQANLAHSEIRAPITGTVLELKLAEGQRGSVGDSVVVIADTSKLKLTVDVAEIDVPQIQIGQEAEIKLDALQDQIFHGIVEHIAPTNSQDKQDVVSYPVTIRLTGVGNPNVASSGLSVNTVGIRPGMNAVATIRSNDEPRNRWLVPQNAIKQREDGRSMVVVQRGERVSFVDVTVGETIGEWVAVESLGLFAGDAVLGDLASYVDQDNLFQMEGF